jgi:hypothetical protein
MMYGLTIFKPYVRIFQSPVNPSLCKYSLLNNIFSFSLSVCYVTPSPLDVKVHTYIQKTSRKIIVSEA